MASLPSLVVCWVHNFLAGMVLGAGRYQILRFQSRSGSASEFAWAKELTQF